MVEEKVPAFCAVCGSRLIPSDIIEGYDVYTGFPVQSSSFSCNNPTTVITGKGLLAKTSVTQHPSWSLVNGSWEAY